MHDCRDSRVKIIIIEGIVLIGKLFKRIHPKI